MCAEWWLLQTWARSSLSPQNTSKMTRSYLIWCFWYIWSHTHAKVRCFHRRWDVLTLLPSALVESCPTTWFASFLGLDWERRSLYEMLRQVAASSSIKEKGCSQQSNSTEMVIHCVPYQRACVALIQGRKIFVQLALHTYLGSTSIDWTNWN
jgi:hypothetical protein